MHGKGTKCVFGNKNQQRKQHTTKINKIRTGLQNVEDNFHFIQDQASTTLEEMFHPRNTPQ